jgi:tRNA threonylcarbamoyladenosine biosynthesis protein TsaB
MTAGTDDRLLLIETSGRRGHVAVARGGELRAERALDEARRHARDLAPAVRELLAEQGWRPTDIAAVLVSLGPGSYTGLRVGVISAKAFAYATGCRLVGIETFAAIALQAAPAPAVEVIADAQQDKLYSQRFRLDPARGLPCAETPLRILPFAAWLAQLPPGVAVSGPALTRYRNRLPETVPVADESAWHPRPASLLRLGLDRLTRSEADDLWTLEPLYLRPSAAEEQWRGK